MSPEHQIKQAQRHIQHADVMMGEASQLDDIAARLMAVQRHWNDPNRTLHLMTALEASRSIWHAIQDALAEGALTLNGVELATGDGASTEQPGPLTMKAVRATEALLFDLN